MRENSSFPNIAEELESEDYKNEYDRHLEILNSFLRALMFINLNCSRSESLKNKLFCLSVIDDMLQSLVAIKCLSAEGVRNTCRRELRYLIELAIKACLISQQLSEKTSEEQIEQFRDILRSTNISMIKSINFHLFDETQKEQFVTTTTRMYGELCRYVHSTPYQMEERVRLGTIGRHIGFEGIDELRELNDEIGSALSSVLILLFHAIPQWCVGDYIVERNGNTVDTYYSKYGFFAAIDKQFDYKHERQDKLEEIQTIRNLRMCYKST